MRPANTLIVSAALLGFALLVWPTRFRYGTTTISEQTLTTRSNRLTGHTDLLVGTEWVPVTEFNVGPSLPPTVEIPAGALASVTGTADAPMGTMYLNLYNGSAWQVTELTVQVTGKGARGATLWSRTYRTPANLRPLESGIVSFTFTQDPTMKTFDWFLAAAKGRLIDSIPGH